MHSHAVCFCCVGLIMLFKQIKENILQKVKSLAIVIINC